MECQLVVMNKKVFRFNELVVVSDNASHHAGTVGHFRFYGKGVSNGTAVVAVKVDEKKEKLISVKIEDLRYD